MTGWDADDYDRRFGFVTELGSPVLDLLGAVPGERVLDLGCGTGHQAAALAAAGCEVVGLDVDAAMVARARDVHAGQPGLRFVLGDAQVAATLAALDVGDGFDAVLSNAALHWMTDVAATLATVRAALRPGGRFVAEMGGAGNVRTARSAIAAALVDLGVPADTAEATVSARSWFPTVGQQSTALEAAGFVVRRMELVDRPTPLAAGDTLWSWTTMFRPWAADLVPDERASELAARVDSHGAGLGLRRDDGSWWIDYVRLRLVAVAP